MLIKCGGPGLTIGGWVSKSEERLACIGEVLGSSTGLATSLFPVLAGYILFGGGGSS